MTCWEAMGLGVGLELTDLHHCGLNRKIVRRHKSRYPIRFEVVEHNDILSIQNESDHSRLGPKSQIFTPHHYRATVS